MIYVLYSNKTVCFQQTHKLSSDFDFLIAFIYIIQFQLHVKHALEDIKVVFPLHVNNVDNHRRWYIVLQNAGGKMPSNCIWNPCLLSGFSQSICHSPPSPSFQLPTPSLCQCIDLTGMGLLDNSPPLHERGIAN